MNRRGLLIILSSPSGAGKSTLARGLRAWDDTLKFSVSATTRPMRGSEEDGKDYFFVSHGYFDDMVAKGEMLEHATVFENSYGSPMGPVQNAIDNGTDVLFDIDWQGAQQIANSPLAHSVLSIFILPPSIKALHQRLQSRGQDSAEVIEKRMSKSWDEISHWDGYDYVLINDDFDDTLAKLKSIICAQRLRRTQQPGLFSTIQKLKSEFEDLL